MKKMMLIACLALAAPTLALADNDKLPAGALSTTQLTTQLQGQGYTVNKIETDDGAYKVKVVNTAGQKQKLKVNALTGAVLSTEKDD